MATPVETRLDKIRSAREAFIERGIVDAPDFDSQELRMIVAPTIAEREQLLSKSESWLPDSCRPFLSKLSSGVHALVAFLR